MEITQCTLVVATALALAVALLSAPLWFSIFFKVRIGADDLFPSLQVQWQPVMALATCVLLVAMAIKGQPTQIAIAPCKHPQMVACR